MVYGADCSTLERVVGESIGLRARQHADANRAAAVWQPDLTSSGAGPTGSALPPSGSTIAGCQRAPGKAAHPAHEVGRAAAEHLRVRRSRRRQRRTPRAPLVRRAEPQPRPCGHDEGGLRRRRAPSTSSANSRPGDRHDRSSSNSSSGPTSVISSVAASVSFPTSAFASRCDQGSIGPARERLATAAPAPAILDGRQQPGSESRARIAHAHRPGHRVELDGVAGPRRNGSGRDGSNGLTGVRPIICQPPGVSTG